MNTKHRIAKLEQERTSTGSGIARTQEYVNRMLKDAEPEERQEILGLLGSPISGAANKRDGQE